MAEDRHGHLARLAWQVREEARRELARASAAALAAQLVARQGPPDKGEPRLTLEQSEELASLIIRADSFNNARAMLEDAPEDLFGAHGRWVTVDALAAATDAAHQEVVRYKREIGLEDGPPEGRQPESGRQDRSCA